MLNQVKEQLRALAYRKLEGTSRRNLHPVALHALNLASIVNELLGRPIRAADEVSPAAGDARPEGATPGGPAGPTPTPTPVPMTRAQAPVVMYFDGKDHRTKAKVEELLRSRDIAFKILDVADDEAERSWITTAAKSTELPIVVIAGIPVGGLHELTQMDLAGDLVRRVFPIQ